MCIGPLGSGVSTVSQDIPPGRGAPPGRAPDTPDDVPALAAPARAIDSDCDIREPPPSSVGTAAGRAGTRKAREDHPPRAPSYDSRPSGTGSSGTGPRPRTGPAFLS
ncbi:hypothetical protein GCM10010505_44400 [Kitasatospora aburaviensis]